MDEYLTIDGGDPVTDSSSTASKLLCSLWTFAMPVRIGVRPGKENIYGQRTNRWKKFKHRSSVIQGIRLPSDWDEPRAIKPDDIIEVEARSIAKRCAECRCLRKWQTKIFPGARRAGLRAHAAAVRISANDNAG